MDDLVVPVQFRAGEIYFKKLSAVEQLKSHSVALELFRSFADILFLDEASLWAAAQNAALVYFSLVNKNLEGFAPCFPSSDDVIHCLGLDDIAYLAAQYYTAFPVCDVEEDV